MAFKSVAEVKAQKYSGKFILENDGDSADVVFLYQDASEVMVADVHYIKSADYNGYVHCVGGGCPACMKNIRTQTKLFVPMYVLSSNGKEVNEIQFWDRTMKFEPQLQSDVFKFYANPTEYVFRITRVGAHGDINTRYTIAVVGRNSIAPYAEILAKNNATFPAYYENIVKDVDANILNAWLANSDNAAANASLPDYVATPRVDIAATATVDLPEVVDTTEEITDEVNFD